MELHRRKPNRLKNYDYSRPGCYFITICVKDRAPLFWTYNASHVGADIIRPRPPTPMAPQADQSNSGADIIHPQSPALSRYGRIAERAILDIPGHYANVTLDKYVIMPNHIHVLLRLTAPSGRIISAPTKGVDIIIGQMKRIVSKKAGFDLWQKGFHDHIVRGRADYLRIWNYIEANPAKWKEDCYYMVPEV